MKTSKIASILFGCVAMANANAADIKIFHSPSCPHCRHAREFIENTLIYEYNDLKVTEINVMSSDNRQEFVDAIYKCGYKSGGVPVIIVGEKCFQGYADSMQDTLRAAVEVDLNDEQKQSAKDNKAKMAENKDEFVAAHADRKQTLIFQEGKKK
jgi:glutaredoxin